MQKMKLDFYFNITHRNLLKCIKDLNIRPKPIKILEKNIRGKLLATNLGNDFRHMIF